MTESLKKYILPFSAVIVLFAGALFYVGVITPLHEEAHHNETETKLLKKQNEMPVVHEASAPSMIENTYTLQQEVPVKPLVDQFMLQLEKAEVLSDSIIEGMEFKGEDGSAAPAQGQQTSQASTGSSSQNSSNTSDTNSTTASQTGKTEDPKTGSHKETAAVPLAGAPLPEGVKKTSVELTVTSKDYNGLARFVKEVEKLKRISIIEGVAFTGPEEELPSTEDTPLMAEDQPEGLSFKILISAYYLPELTQYLKDLPKMKFDQPVEKKDPLTNAELPNEKKK
ncbi:type IV pilus assembly protein PilO [Bacillus sp. OV194]|nr:type IV pilus assembly protein PilO [Bacillus sp. OV194]